MRIVCDFNFCYIFMNILQLTRIPFSLIFYIIAWLKPVDSSSTISCEWQIGPKIHTYKEVESSQGSYSWKMLSRLWLDYDDLENNMVFLNLVIDIMGWLWMLWYINHVINLAWIASVARYTLFITVCKQWRNYFFVKKIKFRKKWRKGVYTLFVIDSSFRKHVVET